MADTTRVAGYDLAQIVNAATIAAVAQAWGLGDHGALLGLMCAMGESSLRNINYGDWETNGVRNPDGTPTTSIGLFQQQASWGAASDRMDPVYSAWKFFDALTKVRGWKELAPTIAIHRVQVNADPNHYAKYETPARAVLAAIPDLREEGTIMADPMDIIEVPWQRGMFGRRALIDALDRAGRPRINSMHRTYGQQKKFWDDSPAMGGNGSPADNPDRPDLYELGHVRGIAADIDVNAENVRRLAAVGLVRPFSWEGWHWRLPGSVQKWPLMFSIPAASSGNNTKPFEEDDMTPDQSAQLKRVDEFFTALGGVEFAKKLAAVEMFNGVPGVDLSTPRLRLALDAAIDTRDRFVVDENGDGAKDYDLAQYVRNRMQPSINDIAAAINLDVLADKIAERVVRGNAAG